MLGNLGRTPVVRPWVSILGVIRGSTSRLNDALRVVEKCLCATGGVALKTRKTCQGPPQPISFLGHAEKVRTYIHLGEMAAEASVICRRFPRSSHPLDRGSVSETPTSHGAKILGPIHLAHGARLGLSCPPLLISLPVDFTVQERPHGTRHM
jgi:hypothetical protein